MALNDITAHAQRVALTALATWYWSRAPQADPGMSEPDHHAPASETAANYAAQLEGFDPLALLAGSWAPVQLFLAPFTPAFAAARDEYLTSASGPLAAMATGLQQQSGATAEVARDQTTALLRAATGMAVVVVEGPHGLATIAQLCFGHLSPDWVEAFITACGSAAGDGQLLRSWITQIARRAAPGSGNTILAELIVGGDDQARQSWLDLAYDVADQIHLDGADNHAADATVNRLHDLAWWISQALAALGGAMSGEDLVAVTTCLLIAGDQANATRLLLQLAAGDPEAACDLISASARFALRSGDPLPTATVIAKLAPTIEAAIGPSYDLHLSLFALYAGAGDERVIAAARQLMAVDRKSARHDLTREPRWRVVAANPGELVDVATAATLIDRSLQFIAKRLEAGTLPHHHDGTRLRLPRAALLAWQQIMSEHQLL